MLDYSNQHKVVTNPNILIFENSVKQTKFNFVYFKVKMYYYC